MKKLPYIKLNSHKYKREFTFLPESYMTKFQNLVKKLDCKQIKVEEQTQHNNVIIKSEL